MLFNKDQIDIFSPQFALLRVQNGNNKKNHNLLGFELREAPNTRIDSTQSDSMPSHIGFWYNYPENIAVLIKKQDAYMLQTFSKKHLGKLYENISENEKEIRKYFEKHTDNLIVLDDVFYAKTIKPDYDALTTYIKLAEAIKNAESLFRQAYTTLKRSKHMLSTLSDNCSALDPEGFFNEVAEFANEVITDFRKASKQISTEETRMLENCLAPITKEEANGVIFALYLYQHRSQNGSSSTLIDQATIDRHFQQFISENPDAVDYFCKNLGNLEQNKQTVLNELEKAGLTKKIYSSIADEVLG